MQTRALLVAALLLGTPLAARPALAATAATVEQLVGNLLAAEQLKTTDRIWINVQVAKASARDVAACDALSAELAARGLPVMWDVGTGAAPAAGSFADQLAALKVLGVTKWLSLSPVDDMGNVTVRIVEVPTGWLKGVQTARLDRIGTMTSPLVIGLNPQLLPGHPVDRIAQPVVVAAPETPFNWTPEHGLGLQYSWLSGTGVTYRRWFGGWGLQVAGIPFLVQTNGQLNGFANLGMQGMLVHLQTDRLRLYSLVGFGAGYQKYTSTAYDDKTGATGSQTYEKWDLGLAPGVGLDIRVFDRFILSGALGYTFSRQRLVPAEPTYGYAPGATFGVMLEW